MIRETFIAALSRRFPGRGMRVGVPPGSMVTFPAAHPAVGDLTIYDDGDEATVDIREITHSHFNTYGQSLSEEERTERIIEQVMYFLGRLFADRVLLFKDRDNRGGGSRVLDDDAAIPPVRESELGFLWSGPIAS